LGVELGQLLFIAAVLSLAMAWRRLVWQPSPRFAQSIAFGIGSLAVFWTFERVTGFLPAV